MDTDFIELSRRVDEVAKEIACFRHAELAGRIPVSSTVVRSSRKGQPIAVAWQARWADRKGGPILCEVTGYLNDPVGPPLFSRAFEIGRPSSRFVRLIGA